MSGVPNLLYPRLQRVHARKLLRERGNRTLLELRELGSLSHPEAAPAAAGGTPAREQRLKSVQAAVRRCADEADFPKDLTLDRRQSFDRSCGTILFESMKIVPGDAAEEDVWSFISVVLVPEVAPWRFPDPPESRLLGFPRNTLRRLWWRAWSLGPDLNQAPAGCRPLGEDEYVQIMERTSLSGSQTVSRAIRDGIWRAELNKSVPKRSDLMRELTLRVRARQSHVALDCLAPAELERVIDEIVEESVVACETGRTSG